MRGCRRKWRGRVTRQGRGQVIGGDPDPPDPTKGAESELKLAPSAGLHAASADRGPKQEEAEGRRKT